jgi:hypothetical protein
MKSTFLRIRLEGPLKFINRRINQNKEAEDKNSLVSNKTKSFKITFNESLDIFS